MDAAATLADAVVATVTAVPGVAAMHSGRFGEVATYLPGRRVAGLQVHDDQAEIHVTVRWGHDLLSTAAAVRGAVEPLVARPVHVVIEDVIDPTELPTQLPTGPGGAR